MLHVIMRRGGLRMDKDVIAAVKYNIKNFGYVDPAECETVEKFLEFYYANINEELELEEYFDRVDADG